MCERSRLGAAYLADWRAPSFRLAAPWLVAKQTAFHSDCSKLAGMSAALKAAGSGSLIGADQTGEVTPAGEEFTKLPAGFFFL